MPKVNVALRKKGEELVHQRFKNLRQVIQAKKKEAIDSLRSRIEAETTIAELRERRLAIQCEGEKLYAQTCALGREIAALENETERRVNDRSSQLVAAASEMEMQLSDQENRLIEQLWMDSLDTDLRTLVGKVPTATELLSNGFSEEITRLTAPTGQA